MPVVENTVTMNMAEYITLSHPPVEARSRAAIAVCDTVGVILAGVPEPASKIVRKTITSECRGPCRVLGTTDRTSAEQAALANGVAAHAHDYDDMCFVSLAHPSCALVPAALAAAELAGSTGRDVLEAYVVGFELECRLGLIMNPRHYHERGWHCTSSIGTLGAAAAASRLLKLDAVATVHALGIAASSACGVKENIGSMVKPLHAGTAARNGVMAARLAGAGFVASEHAIDGPQGYLIAMDSQKPADAFKAVISDLGSRWEIIDTGVTVKLYPSCAATHPPLDVLLDLKGRHGLTSGNIAAIDIEVDSMTPRLLIHERPTTALEAKFSMPFCAAAAIVFGHPTIETFHESRIRDVRIQKLLPLVTLRANPSFDTMAPLSQTNVTVRLMDGRTVTDCANGARGYPGRLSEAELAAKFMACAQRCVSQTAAARAFNAFRAIESCTSVGELTHLCSVT